MRKKMIGWMVLLFATLALSACASASATPAATEAMPVSATPAVTDAAPVSATLAAPTARPTPMATSRGDKLEASDPASLKTGMGRPVLVEFFRFTWTTCQGMAPMVHGLEAKYAGQVDFFFLDADDPATQVYQKQFGFQYQPYFVLLDGSGKETKRWAGSVSQREFETAFADVMK